MSADMFAPELREVIEWTDAWQDHAEDCAAPRVLLVGDSIARDYYPFVRDLLTGRYRVDRFCTSRFGLDPFFIDEAARYMSLRRYAVIHVNHGLHGQAYSAAAYEDALDKLIRMAAEACPHVIAAASTPVGLKENPSEPEPERTAQVLERNKIARRVAEKYGARYNDLYGAVDGLTGLKKVGDGTHFLPEGSTILGRKVVEEILAF